jgi:streptogramin lyase
MQHWISIPQLTIVILCVFAPAAAWDTTGLVKEWPGDATMRPYDIATLSDGSAWMTHEEYNHTTGIGNGSLITLDYPNGTLLMYTAPFSADFYTLDPAPDGTLWITDYTGRLVHFDPDTLTFEQHPLPVLFPVQRRPYGVSVAPDGRVWFTCQSDDHPCIGMYDPAAGSWERFDLPGGGAYPPGYPVEIDFESDGTVWFTIKITDGHTGNGGLGRVDPATGEVTIWTDPAVFFDGCSSPPGGLMGPWGIVVTGHDPARVWFVDKISALLVRFDEGDPPVVTCHNLSPDDLIDSHFIARDPEGKIWLASMGRNHIGVYDPVTGAVSTFDPRSGRKPMGITISDLGEVWWSETGLYGEGTGMGRFIPFRDSDRDGIDDRVDTKPRGYSNDFLDKKTGTGGIITDRGSQSLTLIKATTPYGVRVMAGPLTTGRDPAVITAKCPGLLWFRKSAAAITANDDFIMTCGRPLLALKGPGTPYLRRIFPSLPGLPGA